jgi:mannose-1-phosphate guanylyltransferase
LAGDVQVLHAEGQVPLHAIVLAGGSGTRLAALTERLAGRPMPKQFCCLGTKGTLVQETVARLAPLAPPDRVLVVALDKHRAVAEAQLAGFPGLELITQPADRGTTPAIALALVHIADRDPDAVVLVTPSDHGVRDAAAYRRGIDRAREAVADGTAPVVLLGVEPDAPRADLGWIVPGAGLAPGARRVEAFVEKPCATEAAALFRRGALFSTMVVVATAHALLDHLRAERPGLAALLAMLFSLPEGARAAHVRRVYGILTPCDFSREMLASAKGMAVVDWPASMGWTDLGTPERVAAWAGDALALAN